MKRPTDKQPHSNDRWARTERALRLSGFLLLAAPVLFFSACGGGNGNKNNGPGPGGTGNTVALQADGGPTGLYVDGVFANVTVCAPGTSTCETISNVLVDTGSYGLRILSSQLTLSLPALKDSSGNVLQECVAYGDGSYTWGPVATADIAMAGETASSIPLQVISETPQYAAPSQCTNSAPGPDDNTLSALGANGIIGLGVFVHDCGSNCTLAPPTNSYWPYYVCPGGACSAVSVALTNQVQNPVASFSSDNNGVILALPSISSSGEVSATGQLIFGIGTQTDNSLGAATVYAGDGNGNIATSYGGQTYESFIDSGSNGLYFLDAATLNIPECTDQPGFYCPSGVLTFSPTNIGCAVGETSPSCSGAAASVTFSIADADTLCPVNGCTNSIFNDLGGDYATSPPLGFDYGAPFFFGRNVYFGINGAAGPGGITGPYYAY